MTTATAEAPRETQLAVATPADTASPSAGSVITTAGQDAKEPAAVLDFLWRTHEYTNEWARFADQKASVVIVVSSGLIGVYQTRGIFERMIRAGPVAWSPVLWLAALGMGLLVLGIGFAAWSIRPRLRAVARPGFVYWGGVVAHGTAARYWDAIRAQQADDLAAYMSEHLFALSAICTEKYLWVNRGVLAAMVGAVVSGIVLLSG